jgi:hypothetical protein
MKPIFSPAAVKALTKLPATDRAVLMAKLQQVATRGFRSTGMMPEDACLYFYIGKHRGFEMTPKPMDCGVFGSKPISLESSRATPQGARQGTTRTFGTVDA